jgi:hypothetical protein
MVEITGTPIAADELPAQPPPEPTAPQRHPLEQSAPADRDPPPGVRSADAGRGRGLGRAREAPAPLDRGRYGDQARCDACRRASSGRRASPSCSATPISASCRTRPRRQPPKATGIPNRSEVAALSAAPREPSSSRALKAGFRRCPIPRPAAREGRRLYRL